MEDFEVLFADYYDFNGMNVFNGLIGLGYEPDVEGQLESYVEALKEQNIISESVFSINYNSNGNLGREIEEPDFDDNHIMFGGWDDSLLKKDKEGEPMIDWVPVIEN